ncbi:MAG: hypothetical protein DRP84_08585 [Spirochaetes bacterium]|nr:MAG: hypothetical protein DRP84_08585 [Spirochaetota bacterium]
MIINPIKNILREKTMKYYDYSDINKLLHDKQLIELLCTNYSFDDLFNLFIKDDFLEFDSGIKIPFFAETRDYRGAREKDKPDSIWIAKPIKEEEVLNVEMAMICFFLDFYTHTLSAPQIITKIDGTLYKATKLIKAAQLSGANYTEIKQLREQLLLDIINRWIYFDEDRNPNNYLLKYNSKNDQIIIAIDFGNADLLTKELKIKGLQDKFGWERIEKTRYLTPLKSENCINYDMEFFNIRFNFFNKLSKEEIKEICETILRFNPDKKSLAERVSTNIKNRIDYVYDYFSEAVPKYCCQKKKTRDIYKDMGKAFNKIYNEDR